MKLRLTSKIFIGLNILSALGNVLALILINFNMVNLICSMAAIGVIIEIIISHKIKFRRQIINVFE